MNRCRWLMPVVPEDVSDQIAQESAEMGLINAFGMFWRRSEVHWTNRGAKLLGAQQSGSLEVDFSGLYDLEGLLVTGGGRYGDRGRRLWVSPLSG
jgi:hypothetical protein